MANVTYYDNGSVSLSDAEIDENFRCVAWKRGDDIASATTLTLTSNKNYYHVTGANGISGIVNLPDNDTANTYGQLVRLVFDDAVALTHHATNFILPGGSFTTAAGDVGTFVNEASNSWRCVAYTRADGTALAVNVTTDMTVGGNLTVSGHTHFGSEETTFSSGGLATVDWTAGNKYSISLTENVNITFTNPAGCANLLLRVVNPATWDITGFTISPGTIKWQAGAGIPAIDVVGTHIISMYYDGTDYYATTGLSFAA